MSRKTPTGRFTNAGENSEPPSAREAVGVILWASKPRIRAAIEKAELPGVTSLARDLPSRPRKQPSNFLL